MYLFHSHSVPLGSVPELPADSCKEIKASEGGQAVSGNYWLDSPRTGNSILARCDMKTEGRDRQNNFLSRMCVANIDRKKTWNLY